MKIFIAKNHPNKKKLLKLFQDEFNRYASKKCERLKIVQVDHWAELPRKEKERIRQELLKPL